jgi:hypothetical protein
MCLNSQPHLHSLLQASTSTILLFFFVLVHKRAQPFADLIFSCTYTVCHRCCSAIIVIIVVKVVISSIAINIVVMVVVAVVVLCGCGCGDARFRAPSANSLKTWRSRVLARLHITDFNRLEFYLLCSALMLLQGGMIFTVR